MTMIPEGVSISDWNGALARQDWKAMLTYLRLAHAEGKPNAARLALSICAVSGIVMPPWLANLVKTALVTSGRGVPDEVFGMGSEARRKAWRKEHLSNRHAAIEQDHEFLKSAGMKGVTPYLADLYSTSTKNVEKIVKKTKK